MKIKINQEHKSIKPTEEFELPEFTILTGKNGSGKSHLLKAISDKAKSQVKVNSIRLSEIKYIGFNELVPQIEEICNPDSINQFIKNAWQSYQNIVIAMRKRSVTMSFDNLVRNGFSNGLYKLFVNNILNETKKEIGNLIEDDFRSCFKVDFMQTSNIFTARFATLFKNYHNQWNSNQYNAYLESKGHKTLTPVLTDKQFIDRFGHAPWNFINEIFAEVKIPYEVNNPEGTDVASNFVLKLKDIDTGIEISSNDLSTGEKVLMSMALAIYNSSEDFQKPELLIIDEPDAGLHPSMSKNLVTILKKYIVDKSGIPAIITTHSPTTVIAAPGESIYQMERGNSVPQKISTQEAVEVLTSDIPFLKVSIEKTRQVFVENAYDAEYYTEIKNIFSLTNKFNSEPIFIPAKTSPGSNCSDVIATVTSLVNAGCDTVYGIIDRDDSNVEDGKVLVLGYGERYSIENYLLDPLLIGILLIREGIRNVSYFKIDSMSNYTGITKITEEDAQKIIDKVLSDLNLGTDSEKYVLVNGWEMNISKSFNNCNGHELEKIYKEKYPELKKYHQEPMLKKDIIKKVINDYPSLAPKRILETMIKIR